MIVCWNCEEKIEPILDATMAKHLIEGDKYIVVTIECPACGSRRSRYVNIASMVNEED